MMYGSLCTFMVLLSCASCKGNVTSNPPTSNPRALLEVDLGIEELRAELLSTLLERYVSMSYGTTTARTDNTAQDRPLQFIGVQSGDEVVGVNPTALQEDHRLYKKRLLQVLAKNSEINLSEDGSVGWVFDEASYRVDFYGLEASIPVRTTAVYVRDVERWLLVAEHLSYTQSVEEIIAEKDGTTRDDMIAMKTSKGNAGAVSDDLLRIVGRYLNGVEDDKPVSPNTEDVLYLLPGAEHEYYGQQRSHVPSLADIFGIGSLCVIKEHQLQLSSSKHVAWMLANIEVRTSNGKEYFLRGSFVFEKRHRSGWGILQSHISTPVSESFLNVKVFGLPGKQQLNEDLFLLKPKEEKVIRVFHGESSQ